MRILIESWSVSIYKREQQRYPAKSSKFFFVVSICLPVGSRKSCQCTGGTGKSGAVIPAVVQAGPGQDSTLPTSADGRAAGNPDSCLDTSSSLRPSSISTLDDSSSSPQDRPASGWWAGTYKHFHQPSGMVDK